MEKVNTAKPFVKWAGGKGQLIKQLKEFIPVELSDGKIENYIEPFVGGGAVLIYVLQNYNIKTATAFDINSDLINCYNSIKGNVQDLIERLYVFENKYKSIDQEERKELFYNIRDKYNSYELGKEEYNVERASEFIFLNKTCFNGLYRVNKDNKFNVPFNNAKNPMICDANNLKMLSELFNKYSVNFKVLDYKNTKQYVNSKTFVYFDPPYRPLNKQSFTSYTKDSFNDDNQRELAEYYSELDKIGAKLMLSNSDPKNTDPTDVFFDELYQGFKIGSIEANRNINAKGDGRKPISELVITNYNS